MYSFKIYRRLFPRTWFSTLQAEGLIWRALAVRILDLRLFFSKLVSTSSWLTELEAIFFRVSIFRLRPKARDEFRWTWASKSRNCNQVFQLLFWHSRVFKRGKKSQSGDFKTLWSTSSGEKEVGSWRPRLKGGNFLTRKWATLSLYLESWINLIICTWCKKNCPKKLNWQVWHWLVFVK